MIIYIASDGQARLVSPQHVYQGSSVTDITVIAPFPAQTVMTVAFSLPDGKMFGGVQGTMQTPPYIMTPLANQPELPDGVQAWQYVMPFAITQNAGQAKVSVTAQFAQGSGQALSFTQQTSAQVEFTIEPSVVGKLPDEPTEDAWAQVLAYMSAQDTKIAAIQSDVADIEQVADEANTNADAALTTANEANTTASQAKDTADGLADSIAQANVTASQAEQTAQEAKEIAEGAAQSNGTRVSVGGAFQQTLSFASDPQTQITANKNAIAEAQSDISDIIDGSQTVGKAAQDANGNVIDTTYAKLSQVVRTDVAQSLTDGQKQQAQNNIAITVTKETTSSEQVGWWRIAQISRNNVYDIKLKQGYSVNFPAEMNVVASVGYMNDANAVLSLAGGYLPNRFAPSKIRVCGNTTACYIDIYTADAAWNTTVVEIKGGPSSSITQTEFSFIGTSDTVDGYNVVILDLVSGTNTSGGVYQNGAPVFATDPSKLEPSTANGWTQTTTTGTLPGAGVYMIAFNHLPTDSQPTYYNPAILVYDGTIGSCTVTDRTGLFLTSMVITPSGIQLSRPTSPGSDVQSTNIYYKRIA